MKTTIGQAIDTAIEMAARQYPGADVYSATAGESSKHPNHFRVELSACHFSQPLVYYVANHVRERGDKFDARDNPRTY